MPQSARPTPCDQGFLNLVHAIISGDDGKVVDLVDASPALVHEQAVVGATRNESDTYFFEAIAHYMYAGDTALHMAAAGFRHEIVQALLDRGADRSVRNRRGAQPLHYAADSNVWNPAAQAATIDRLIRAGADPNATDKSGVPPLHRAVRTRCAAAVQALLAGGAAPRGRNKSGSTPLHLAVQNTGRGDSGAPHTIEQQRQIIELLLRAGARPDDKDENGKTVRDAAKAGWIHTLLQG
jgi:ankyrin repeat protein